MPKLTTLLLTDHPHATHAPGVYWLWLSTVLIPQAADLVRQMMAYRAEDRPLPAQVLEHAWLASGA